MKNPFVDLDLSRRRFVGGVTSALGLLINASAYSKNVTGMRRRDPSYLTHAHSAAKPKSPAKAFFRSEAQQTVSQASGWPVKTSAIKSAFPLLRPRQRRRRQSSSAAPM